MTLRYYEETIRTKDTMISRISQATKRLAGCVGIAYVRVPTVQVANRRPFARDDHRGLLSKVAFPYVRLPAVHVKVFRPFH